MGFSEELNIKILQEFNKAGIEFAFPSQTMYLAGDQNRPVVIAKGDGMTNDGNNQ